MNTLVSDSDTIAAIATAHGAAGIGVIRISGKQAFPIANALTGLQPAPRQASFARFHDTQSEVLDEGLLIQFPGPRSFTGEDVVELHCHGGRVVLNSVLRACLQLGARQAQPGEFSQRAFLNDKIDLVQAEAIADLINSSTEAAARSASRSLAGEFSKRVAEVLEQLIALRVFVEAAIDFPEEEIDFIADSDVLERLDELISTLNNLLKAAQRGRRLRDGMKLVIAGAPNAGKSSLLNRLAGQDSAIVTDIPGTTRDVLREYIEVDGLPLHIVDTAGLRSTQDAVEQEGIRRARSEMLNADHILLVVDSTEIATDTPASTLIAERIDDLPADVPISLLWNKVDLSGQPPSIRSTASVTEIRLSAHTGSGLDLLREHLLHCAGLSGEEQSDFSARERHIQALMTCMTQLERGRQQLAEHGAAELVAQDLRDAQDSLSQITGQYSSDALLGEIFGSFCIGK